jgi:hypothetical protein
MEYAVLFTTSCCQVRTLSSYSMPCHSSALADKLRSHHPRYPHFGFPLLDFPSFIALLFYLSPMLIIILPLSLSAILTFPLPSPFLPPLQHDQVRVCLGHYASRGLKDPLRGKDMHKLVGIEITDSATIRYRREKVRTILQCYL